MSAHRVARDCASRRIILAMGRPLPPRPSAAPRRKSILSGAHVLIPRPALDGTSLNWTWPHPPIGSIARCGMVAMPEADVMAQAFSSRLHQIVRRLQRRVRRHNDGLIVFESLQDRRERFGGVPDSLLSRLHGNRVSRGVQQRIAVRIGASDVGGARMPLAPGLLTMMKDLRAGPKSLRPARGQRCPRSSRLWPARRSERPRSG